MSVKTWLNTKFTVLTKTKQADGYGNYVTTYSDGRMLMCGVVPVSSNEKNVAEHGATDTQYKIIFVGDSLSPGDLIKRLQDNAVFEVLNHSAEWTTPIQATDAMKHSEAVVRRVTIP